MKGEGLFSNLPSPIVIDILSRLPTETIIQCRCVCKIWLKLISEPEFVNLHLSRSPTCFGTNQSSSTPSDSVRLNIFELQDEPDCHPLHYDPVGLKKQLPSGESQNYMKMVGSINGLICLNEYELRQYDTFYVWNPTTRECITVQVPDNLRLYPNVFYGFGLSSVTGQYKVIRISQELDFPRITKSECQVYTLGEGSWRSIGHAPFLYLHECACGVFLNGNLHWLICDRDGPEFISCLDLEKEFFQPFPPPPELTEESNATMNLYQGCLCVCDNSSVSDLVIWVMKDYGVKNSWTKEVVIDKTGESLVGQFYEQIFVARVYKDGEILLILRDDLLMSYHPERKTWIPYFDEEFHPCVEAMVHVSSFLSLESFGIDMVNKV